MFSRILEQIRRSTGFKLTFWYAFVFILSWLVLISAGFTIINKSIRFKDQQLVSGMLDKYALIANSQGIDSLLTSLKNEQLAHITGGYLVIVKSSANELLYMSRPYEWRAVDSDHIINNAPFSETNSVAVSTNQYISVDGGPHRVDELEISGRRLDDGAMLQIGCSAESREEYLEYFRDIFILIMGPIILLSIIIGALLARRALRPIRDLTEAVEQIQSGRIKTRVKLRETDSELRVLAGQFNHMIDRIEALINGMREALDNVAHELRTPLMRMRASIEDAAPADDPGSLQEALFDCAEESERISGMLTSLMDISEAETGVMRLNYTQVNLAELIDEVMELGRYTAEDKNITIEVDIPDNLVVPADHARTRQALGNLVDNAVKYTNEYGQITINAELHNDIVIITVQDNGVGISPEDLPRIFDRLYRGDKSRSEKGLGLGLSLVKAVIEAHQGNIRVESSPGQGSRFIITMPSGKPVSLGN